MKLKLEDGKTFKGIVNTLSGIIDEIVFKITSKAFIMEAMDPSRICLLKVMLERELFDEYDCDGEYKIGINLADLNKILARSGTGDGFIITFNSDDQKIKIQIINEKRKKRKRTFSLALLDIDTEEIQFDTLEMIEYPSQWVMDIGYLIEAIKDGEIYSEILTIKTNEDVGISFASVGQIGEMYGEISIDDLDASEIDGSANGSYSITFLKNILKLSTITKELELSIKDDHPIKLLFTLINTSKLLYFLAPRVEDAGFEDEDDWDDEPETKTEPEIIEEENTEPIGNEDLF